MKESKKVWKQKWLEAIRKTLKQRKYGNAETCNLCKTAGYDKCDDYIDPKCEKCICYDYYLYMMKYTEEIVPRDNDIDWCILIIRNMQKSKHFAHTIIGTPSLVRKYLRKIRDWLKEIQV